VLLPLGGSAGGGTRRRQFADAEFPAYLDIRIRPVPTALMACLAKAIHAQSLLRQRYQEAV
jgi:hypothetical protein